MDSDRLDLTQVTTDEILQGITQKDPVMKELVERIGYFRLKAGGDYFESLVQAIIYQQISGKAADSIYNRFLLKINGPVTPENLEKISDDDLRTCGVSPQKLRYLRDLTSKTLRGELNLTDIKSLSNREIIERLTIVKGIGEWSAQMFLIFTLGRLNVLPFKDIGFMNALKKHYAVRGKITEPKIKRIAKKWEPYISAGVWILWECENTRLPVSGTETM